MTISDFKQNFTHSWRTSLGNPLGENVESKEWLRTEFSKIRDRNPMEWFVLGAVFLFHDAALSLAALPGRLEELRKDSLWTDTKWMRQV